MKRILYFCLPGLLAFSILTVRIAVAQVVEGSVVQERTGAPIDGALVVLLDSLGSRHAGAITDTAGRFRITAASPGRYSLMAERIGYATTRSESFALDVGETLQHRLEVSVRAVTLEGVTARGERRCLVRPAEGVGAHRVWEEARKALTATAVTQESGTVRYRVRRYERDLDPETERIVRENAHFRSGWGIRPFRSLPAERLVAEGFVQGPPGHRIFYLPDADILLSDPFLDTHCFRLIEDDQRRPDQIGLAFEPVRGRRLPDIRGTLWLDRTTAELKELEFRYTRLQRLESARDLGGRVEFDKIGAGAWIVRSWRVRMPTVGVQSGRTALVGLREEGGEVVEVLAGGSVSRPALTASLRGRVTDSLHVRGLAGALVFASGTQHRAITDSVGAFRFEGLSPGRYSISFVDPRFAVGAPAPAVEVELDVGDSASVELGTPSAMTLLSRVCAGELSDRGSSVVYGRVSDVHGDSIPGATVQAELHQPGTGGDPPRRQAASTNSHGYYHFCAHAGAVVSIQLAEAGVGPATVSSVPPGVVVRRDVRLPGRDAALVVGEVLDWSTAEPIESAVVELAGAGRGTVTDAKGRFVIAGVPPGVYTVTLQHIAYGRQSDSLVVSRDTAITIRLAREAIALDPVVVTAESEANRSRRVRGTRVNLLTREEIERVLPRVSSFTHLLRAMRAPGLIVRDDVFYEDSPVRGVCIQSARASTSGDRCKMAEVYLNDVRLSQPEFQLAAIDPASVEEIEYLSPLEAGSRYGTGAGKGVLLIYTRSGARR